MTGLGLEAGSSDFKSFQFTLATLMLSCDVVSEEEMQRQSSTWVPGTEVPNTSNFLIGVRGAFFVISNKPPSTTAEFMLMW